jgi:DNA-binding CsgD family transcriptional regulator
MDSARSITDQNQLEELLLALNLPATVVGSWPDGMRRQLVERAEDFVRDVWDLCALGEPSRPVLSASPSPNSENTVTPDESVSSQQTMIESSETHKPICQQGMGVSCLSNAELRVAELIRHGRSNKTIALELGISRRTVETHATRVFRKLNVESRLQLAVSMR